MLDSTSIVVCYVTERQTFPVQTDPPPLSLLQTHLCFLLVKQMDPLLLSLSQKKRLSQFFLKKSFLKVYFYNFTNPEEFFAGEAPPKLEEVGPYTYRYFPQ